ncbi:Protein involved in cellulose biosynthesis (CelD) [Porphyromonas macacae]|uniref:Protein involved in cellulose biosynthesis (CelD) n=1 Tax=Porphyromonas macacae TaxID=28115 RepID=A0A379E9W0_9PORP|nr:GNAT family N-acetyltransferase [Porphyromonas macacae]SUB89473.1 Protein involved in cellulose biosynthesis (CelD) [Porphyromonas macacae]
MWTFTAYENWDEIYNKDFLNYWESLLEISPTAHVFFTPVMVKIWIETYLPLREMEPLFLVGKDGDNEMLFPLVMWKKNWKMAFQKVIVPVGYSDYDYHDPIFKYSIKEKTVFWTELINFLKNKYNKIDAIEFLGIQDMKTSQWHEDDVCPFLDLKDFHNSEDLLKSFSHSLRKDIRRKTKQLEEDFGKLTMREYHTWEEAEVEFNTFMRIHTDRWPNSYKAPHFHEKLLKLGIPAGVVHFTTLDVNNKSIAWNLGFEYEKVFYYYMAMGDPEYHKYSPSKVHLFYLISRAVDLNYEIYDHLKGAETYKNGWSSGYKCIYKRYVLNHCASSYIKESLLGLRKLLGK